MLTILAKLTQNSDDQLARLNVFALMLALNQLLYTPSLMLMAGHQAACTWPVAITALPFALTPWLSSRLPLTARLWVPLVGIIDSLLAQFVMGRDSGAWVFVLPSLALAALLLKERERFWLGGLTLLAMAALIMPTGAQSLPPEIAATIARINEGSVIILTGFIGWIFIREK